MKGINYMEIKNYVDILKHMNTKFPLEECTIKDKNNLDIYESNEQYLCLIADKRFSNELVLKVMKPYIWVGKNSDDEQLRKDYKDFIGYGWMNIYNENDFVDNYENPIKEYDDYVIGFVKYNNENDESIWELLNTTD